MLKKKSTVFSDADMEWNFRKSYGCTVSYKLQILLGFLALANIAILIFDLRNSGDVLLISLRMFIFALILILMYHIGKRGITKKYYSLMKPMIFLSIVLPLYRYHVYQNISGDLYKTDLALVTLSLWTVIRSIFLILPTSWVIVSTMVHVSAFLALAVYEEGVVFFTDHLHHLFVLIIFIGILFFIVWQINKLLHDSYYMREVAYKKLETLRRVESSFVVETTSQVLAHEIKTPLATASGYAQILNADKTLSKSGALMSSKILESCRTIDDITKSIRELSFDGMRLKKDFVLDILNDAKSLWQMAREYNKATLNVTGINASVLVDRVLLQSAMSNIIRNAMEVRKHSLVWVHVTEEGQMVKVSIENNTEMKGDVDNIFSVYKSSDKKNSTGLGLAFSKDVIEKMGGSIECFSEHGKTCFTINLPKG